MRKSTEPQINPGRKYKSRKERPCDACRKRKICCTRDANETVCSLCRTRGESCKYVLPPNVRRNRPPAARPRMSTSSSSSTISIPPRPVQFFPSGTGSTSPSSTTTSEWICQFVGLSGDQDPFVLRHCSFDSLNCYKTPDWSVLRVKGTNDIPLHFTVVPDIHLDARPTYCPDPDTEAILGQYGEDLLRTYFEVIHVSYPLLDPSCFSSKPQPGDPLLAVMYNLASPLCQEDPHKFPQLSDFIHQTLRGPPRLETIEASLLHLQRHTSIHRTPTLPGLWSDIGSLVGMAHDLGLNLDPSQWSLSPPDANRRIRIWWALYIQDKWCALGFGRPSYLNEEHSSVSLPSIDNFSHMGLHNSPLGLAPALQFVAMAHLTTILSDLLNTFYSLRALDRIRLLPVEMLYHIIDDFQGRLHSWNEDHLCQLYNVNTLLDSSGTVVLAYYTCEVVLFRAILRALPIGHPGYPGIRAEAKRTLLNVIDLLEKLNVNQLRAFWWSPMTQVSFSLTGTFMFSQLLASITPQDIEFWSSTISHYRSLLRLRSLSFDMTKLACARMDLLAAGMGVDSPLPLDTDDDDGEAGRPGREAIDRGLKKFELQPGSAEEWIARQGNEGLLLC